MAQLIILPAAEADLEDIWLYIAADNPPAADRFLERILERCHLLATFPYMGQARPDLLPALRSFPIEDYVIFYRPVPDGVEIIRVLHGKRKITKQSLRQ